MTEAGARAGLATRDAVDEAVEAARERYAAARPRTAELHRRAAGFLPGGNTRSVLYHPPFPLRITRAWDSMLEDADGHQYADLLGSTRRGSTATLTRC
jgi:glutamate-1-semialdehyde 2,1-aminomutase